MGSEAFPSSVVLGQALSRLEKPWVMLGQVFQPGQGWRALLISTVPL